MAAGSEWEHVVFKRESYIFFAIGRHMKYAYHKWDTRERQAHGEHETKCDDVTWENPLKTRVNFEKRKKQSYNDDDDDERIKQNKKKLKQN